MTQVLILCTANSARSQMAEGLLRDITHQQGQSMDVYSAGAFPSTVNPLAIEAMHEIGLDISQQRSKSLTEFLNQPFDYVITVCDNAAESCPIFPGSAQRIHWSLPDPAAVKGSHEQQLESFRQVRNDLEGYFQDWVRTLSRLTHRGQRSRLLRADAPSFAYFPADGKITVTFPEGVCVSGCRCCAYRGRAQNITIKCDK